MIGQIHSLEELREYGVQSYEQGKSIRIQQTHETEDTKKINGMLIYQMAQKEEAKSSAFRVM